MDLTYIKGNWAMEQFDGIDGIVLGCVREASKNFFGGKEKLSIGGLLAMDESLGSFVMQLARYAIVSRFLLLLITKLVLNLC